MCRNGTLWEQSLTDNRVVHEPRLRAVSKHENVREMIHYVSPIQMSRINSVEHGQGVKHILNTAGCGSQMRSVGSALKSYEWNARVSHNERCGSLRRCGKIGRKHCQMQSCKHCRELQSHPEIHRTGRMDYERQVNARWRGGTTVDTKILG